MTINTNVPIYDQGNRGVCGNYAYIAAINAQGVFPDIKDTTEKLGLTHPRTSRIFIDKGIISDTVQMGSVGMVDLWLRKGHYIIASTSRGNFVKASKEPFILGFDGKSQHFFVIVDNLGDRWKCQNSWGKGWGDGGFFYLMKSDFRFLFTPRRVVI